MRTAAPSRISPAVGSFDLPAGGGYGNGSGGNSGARGTVASAGFGNGVAAQARRKSRPGPHSEHKLCKRRSPRLTRHARSRPPIISRSQLRFPFKASQPPCIAPKRASLRWKAKFC